MTSRAPHGLFHGLLASILPNARHQRENGILAIEAVNTAATLHQGENAQHPSDKFADLPLATTSATIAPLVLQRKVDIA